MDQSKSPEQRAEERFPLGPEFDEHGRSVPGNTRNRDAALGFATCYREEVEPCRKMIQELVDAMEGTKRNVSWWREHPSESWIHDALAKAKEQFGIEPSKP